MNSPIGWGLPIVAGVATAVALAAESNDAIALPAALAAVATAGLALVRVTQQTSSPDDARTLPNLPESIAPEMSDEWFDQGPLGHEAIVLMLDRIDRSLLHPDLPTREAAELTELRTLPEEDFLEYVAARLDELEGAS